MSAETMFNDSVFRAIDSHICRLQTDLDFFSRQPHIKYADGTCPNPRGNERLAKNGMLLLDVIYRRDGAIVSRPLLISHLLASAYCRPALRGARSGFQPYESWSWLADTANELDLEKHVPERSDKSPLEEKHYSRVVLALIGAVMLNEGSDLGVAEAFIDQLGLMPQDFPERKKILDNVGPVCGLAGDETVGEEHPTTELQEEGVGPVPGTSKEDLEKLKQEKAAEEAENSGTGVEDVPQDELDEFERALTEDGYESEEE